MRINESPALTRIFPISSLIRGSRKQAIDLLREQISELKQQKKCYDKMIFERRKAIRFLLTESGKKP